jgi:hypothetical protein
MYRSDRDLRSGYRGRAAPAGSFQRLRSVWLLHNERLPVSFLQS